ncbi:TcdA/TcdB catalytic glycosyltransferase domain-containing protein, partial [Burkholderia ubonensis]|uniref:TcdA/TcdB catalytic glycosyltransferase domain-containing protein n=1 Tax=Burkholderia ubonensis TaxID=101571 RepID=UPI000A887855
MTVSIMSVSEFRSRTLTWIGRLTGSQNKYYNEIIKALGEYQNAASASPARATEWSAAIALRGAIDGFLRNVETTSQKYPGVRFLENQLTSRQAEISRSVTTPISTSEIHYAWLGKLGGNQKDYITLCAKANPGKTINIWYDPNATLAYELSVRVKKQVYAENISSSFYTDDAQFKRLAIEKAIALQNEANDFIVKKIAEGKTFDQAATDFMASRLNASRAELEGIAKENRDSYLNLGLDNVKLKDNSELFAINSGKTDPILADGSLRAAYIQELAMRGNLSAPSDIVRYLALRQYGGLYLDADLLPTFNVDIFGPPGGAGLELARMQAVMEYLSKIGIVKNRNPANYSDYISPLSEGQRRDIYAAIDRFAEMHAGQGVSVWFSSIDDIKVLPNSVASLYINNRGLSSGAVASSKGAGVAVDALNIIKRNYLALKDSGFDRGYIAPSVDNANRYYEALVKRGNELGVNLPSFGDAAYIVDGFRYREDGLNSASRASIATSGPSVLREAIVKSVGADFYNSARDDASNSIYLSGVNSYTEEEQKHSWIGDVSERKSNIYAEDTQYERQIIIELQPRSTADSVVNRAAGYLYQKHPGKTQWLKYESGKLVSVAGDVVELPANSRIIVVGKGDLAASTLGGLKGAKLAELLSPKIGNEGVKRISLVGCNLGSDANYATDLLKGLASTGKKVADGVTARSSLVQVDAFGEKWTAILNEGSITGWRNGNDGTSKIKIYLDASGQARSQAVVDDSGEVVRLSDLAPEAVSGALDQLRERGLKGLSPVRVGDVTLDPVLLDAMGVLGTGGRVSEERLYALKDAVTGVIDPAKLFFDRSFFTQFFTDSHDAVTMQQTARLVKAVLVANKNDTGKLFVDTAFAGSGTLGHQYAKAIADAVTAAGQVSSGLSAQLQQIASNYQQECLLEQFEDTLGLNVSDAPTAKALLNYAEQLSGVNVNDLDALRSRFPTLTEAQLIEKAAIDATRRSLQGNAQAEEALKVGRWTSRDAERFLSDNGVLIRGSDGQSVVKASALERLIGRGSALDHIRVVTALRLIDQKIAMTSAAKLLNSADPEIQNLGRALSSSRTGLDAPRISETATTVGGDALAVFTTLTSVQQIITNWSQLSSA